MALSKGEFVMQDALEQFAIDLLLYKVKHETKASCHRYSFHSSLVCKLWMYASASCACVRLLGLL